MIDIQCYHNINNDQKVQGFLDYGVCSDLENTVRYNVYTVLEDNNIINTNYTGDDEIEYMCIYAHGSRVFGYPKKNSDIDFVLFYKGIIDEDSLFNIFANESIYIEHVKCDFNPIEIEDESDIEYYIQKHDIEYYKKLNEIYNFAIDDFDFNDTQNEQPKKEYIKSDKSLQHLLEWNKLIKKFDEGNELTKDELSRIAYLSNQLGFKYDEKYEGYWQNNKFFLSDAIDWVCQVDPHADLNWWDVSSITEMDNLFAEGNCKKFNGDISKWDVSNVKDMGNMFRDSEFNGDISNWDVSNVKYMHAMFRNSKFNQNIGNWNVSNCGSCSFMFMNSAFNQDISKWKLPVGCNIDRMFGEYEAGKDFGDDVKGYTINKEFMPPKVRAQYTRYEKQRKQ